MKELENNTDRYKEQNDNIYSHVYIKGVTLSSHYKLILCAIKIIINKYKYTNNYVMFTCEEILIEEEKQSPKRQATIIYIPIAFMVLYMYIRLVEVLSHWNTVMEMARSRGCWSYHFSKPSSENKNVRNQMKSGRGGGVGKRFTFLQYPWT